MALIRPKLLIATRNSGKMREYQHLFRELPFQLLSLDDLGIATEVEETGQTFLENAWLKANTYAALSGLLTLSDDSGLEVGRPGRGARDPLGALRRRRGIFRPTGFRPTGFRPREGLSAAEQPGRCALAAANRPIPLCHRHSPLTGHDHEHGHSL